MQLGLDLGDTGPAKPGISWKRYPQVVHVDYEMFVGNEPNGVWICGCGHQTALRPYYIVMPNGQMLERKFRLLNEAKAAAIAALTEDTIE
jgi:hypothetical protein